MAIVGHGPGFDTLAYARTLRESGVEAGQAEATRTARAGLATRADIDRLEIRIGAKIDRLETRMLRVAIAIVPAQTALTAGLTFGLLRIFGGAG